LDANLIEDGRLKKVECITCKLFRTDECAYAGSNLGTACCARYEEKPYRPVGYQNCENEKKIRKDERVKVLDEVLKLPKNREQPNGSMYIFVEKIERLRNPECNVCGNMGARCP